MMSQTKAMDKGERILLCVTNRPHTLTDDLTESGENSTPDPCHLLSLTAAPLSTAKIP